MKKKKERKRIVPRLFKLLFLLMVVGVCGYLGFRFLGVLAINNDMQAVLEGSLDANKAYDNTVTLLVVEERDYEKGTNEIAYGFLAVENRQDGGAAIFYIPPWVYLRGGRFSSLNYFGLNSTFGRGYVDLVREVEKGFAIRVDDMIFIDVEDLLSNKNGIPFYSDGQGEISANLEDLIEKQRKGSIEESEVRSLLAWTTQKNSKFADLFLSTDLDGYYAGIITNMSFKDSYSFLSRGGGLASNGTIINIGERNGSVAGLYTREELSDTGEFVYQLDTQEIDNKIRSLKGIFFDQDVVREQARVEVYNAGDSAGMASFYRRLLQNLGFNVIRHGNCPVNYDKTTVFVSDEQKFASSLNIVKGLFIIDIEVVDERPDFMNTGDIVVIIH